MGFVKRYASKREDQVWRNVPLAPGEQRIDYAHLVAAVSTDVPGTALLTDRRFLWLDQSGSVRMDFELSRCGGFATTDARPGQTGLVLGFSMSPDGEPEPFVMFPQQPRSSANRQLAAAFFSNVVSQLRIVHPEWGAPA